MKITCMKWAWFNVQGKQIFRYMFAIVMCSMHIQNLQIYICKNKQQSLSCTVLFHLDNLLKQFYSYIYNYLFSFVINFLKVNMQYVFTLLENTLSGKCMIIISEFIILKHWWFFEKWKHIIPIYTIVQYVRVQYSCTEQETVVSLEQDIIITCRNNGYFHYKKM